jgi:small subunit ribosomal protein S8
MTDPIADLLTRIRNANTIRREKVDAPYSKIKEGILEVLKREGFIRDFTSFGEGKMKTLRVFLKYGPQREFVIQSIKRESKPGRRVFKSVSDLNPVVDGMGIAVLTTPQGILSDRECRERKVGGEVLLTIW